LYPTLVRDARFYVFQLKADRTLLAAAREGVCVVCGGALHSSDYPRKPRGGPAGLAEDADLRYSLCCADRECRKRHTPPSLRFLGRKVYWSTVVVVVSAMRHGTSPARMRKLQELFGVSRRTVERWRDWWREAFAKSPFWRIASAAFMPPVLTEFLPAALLERFSGDDEARLVGLLRLLGPITGGAGLAHAP
jgi:Homeodomain-like domain